MLKGKNKNALIIPLLAVLSGFIVGAVLMLVFGYNPFKTTLTCLPAHSATFIPSAKRCAT